MIYLKQCFVPLAIFAIVGCSVNDWSDEIKPLNQCHVNAIDCENFPDDFAENYANYGIGIDDCSDYNAFEANGPVVEIVYDGETMSYSSTGGIFSDDNYARGGWDKSKVRITQIIFAVNRFEKDLDTLPKYNISIEASCETLQGVNLALYNGYPGDLDVGIFDKVFLRFFTPDYPYGSNVFAIRSNVVSHVDATGNAPVESKCVQRDPQIALYDGEHYYDSVTGQVCVP